MQQLLAPLRQEDALGRRTWSEWLGDPRRYGRRSYLELTAVFSARLLRRVRINRRGPRP